MMNKIFTIPLFILMLMGVDIAHAQQITEKEEDQKVNTLTIATVNLYEAEIVSSETNKFTVSFDIHNKEGYQSNVEYAIEVFRVNDDAQELMDRKVYRDVLMLGQDELIKKEIQYVAPSYLDGKFQVWVVARNSTGLPLAHIHAGDMELDNDEAMENNADVSCTVIVDGKNAELGGGIMLEKNEKASIDCELINKSADKVETEVKLRINKGNGFLGEAVEFENKQKASLLKDEKKSINFEFPENREPGSYNGVIILEKNGDVLTKPIYFSYFVSGETATIANLRLDKIFYQKGETINASFFWMGSGEAMDAEKNSFRGDVNIEIVGENGNICARKTGDNLEVGVGEISLTSEIECNNPTVNASVTKDGRELTKSSFSFKNNASGTAVDDFMGNKKTSKDKVISDKIMMLILFGIIPFLALIIFLFSKKRNQKTFNFLLILMPIVFGLVGISSAKADTFSINPIGDMARGILTMNLDKSSYSTDEYVEISLSVYNIDNFTGQYYIDYGTTSTYFGGSFNPVVNGKTSSPTVKRTLPLDLIPGNYSAYFAAKDYTCAGGLWACAGSGSIPFTVYVSNPALEFKVNKTSINKGESVSLSWLTSNIWLAPISYSMKPILPGSCIASGGWTGSKFVYGGAESFSPTVDTVYELECVNSFGTSTGKKSITVNINSPIPIINGSCGSSSGATFSTVPITNLCASGTASALTGSGPWNWTCIGSGGGATASCSANKACISSYSAHSCYRTTSVDCGNIANCGQSGTESASCLALDSCTGATVSRPLSECGASCVTGTPIQCPTCPQPFSTGTWREVSP